MPELDNCSICGQLYIRNLRGICDACRKEEDKLFDKVYQFIKRRENRTANISEIVEATGVHEDTIMRFVKEGRLHTTQFPNIGYRCEKCGTIIQKGKLCVKCASSFNSELKQFVSEEERKQKIREQEKHARTYYTES